MKNKTDLVLGLARSGTAYAPRYEITNPDLLCWNAEKQEWVLEGGTLYENLNEAARVIQDLLRQHYGQLPQRKFEVPVQLVLHSEDEVDRMELVEWLIKTAKLSIDVETHGNGPRAGTLVEFLVEWDGLEEKQ